jgi:DNA-directed RNA polymerase specialized sigma24 family protein
MTDDSVEHKRLGEVLPPDQRRDLQLIYGRIIAVAMQKGLSKAEALDVAQQVGMLVIAKGNQYVERPGTPYLAWLWTVSVNHLTDVLRSRAAQRRLTERLWREPDADRQPDAEQQLTNHEAQSNRDRLLEALPGQDRLVFLIWARQNDGEIDRAEASDRLGMSVVAYEAAKKRVRRAVAAAQLRLGLRAEHFWSHEPLRAAAGASRVEEE